MILIISTCKEKLHELEFVKPIEKILERNKIKFLTKHYSNLTERDLTKASKIIICGTSLKDFEYINHLEKFEWIRDFERPILGICAGMQIIGIIFGAKTKKKQEIGIKKINLRKNFLGINKNFEGYFLHNLSIKKQNDFEIFADSGTDISAIKYISRPIYGVLFHPEVRNKKLIENFVKL